MLPHDQHISAFLRVLITELNAREAFDATALIHTDDMGASWQGRTVYNAVVAVAREGIDQGHAAQPLDVMDVNAHLLNAGHLTNEAFRAFWNELVAPTAPKPPAKYQLRELARRVTESHFRARHAEIYNRDDSHLRPIEEITTEMNAHREELLSIYARMSRTARSLAVVPEQNGGAA